MAYDTSNHVGHHIKNTPLMKIYFTLFFIITNVFICSSQKEKILDDCQNVILETFTYSDLNPTHKATSDSINYNFRKALENRSLKGSKSQKNNEIELLFNEVYTNATCFYDDSPDSRRYKVRRALLFATIALHSKNDKAYTFIEYAKFSLAGTIEESVDDWIKEQYISLLLIELLLKIEENNIYRSDIIKIETYLETNKAYINNSKYTHIKEILDKIEIEK